MMYCWWLTRTEVLTTVNWDDALLMVNQNWCVDNGQQRWGIGEG